MGLRLSLDIKRHNVGPKPSKGGNNLFEIVQCLVHGSFRKRVEAYHLSNPDGPTGSRHDDHPTVAGHEACFEAFHSRLFSEDLKSLSRPIQGLSHRPRLDERILKKISSM